MKHVFQLLFNCEKFVFIKTLILNDATYNYVRSLKKKIRSIDVHLAYIRISKKILNGAGMVSCKFLVKTQRNAAAAAAAIPAWLNWVPSLVNPPKTDPPRAKCIGKGDNLHRKHVFLNESKQITLETKESATIPFRNQLSVISISY